MFGIHKQPLLDWLYTGRVGEPKRQTIGGQVVRIWTQSDVEPSAQVQGAELPQRQRPEERGLNRSAPCQCDQHRHDANQGTYEGGTQWLYINVTPHLHSLKNQLSQLLAWHFTRVSVCPTKAPNPNSATCANMRRLVDLKSSNTSIPGFPARSRTGLR